MLFRICKRMLNPFEITRPIAGERIRGIAQPLARSHHSSRATGVDGLVGNELLICCE